MPWAPRDSRTGLYKACWRDAGGGQRSVSGFKQKAAALRFAGEQEGKERRGLSSVPGRGAPTWGDWYPDWMRLRRIEASTRHHDEMRARNHLSERWDGMRLNKITKDQVQEWVNELYDDGDGLSAATTHRCFHLLSASLKAAVPTYLAVSPCQGVKLPTPTTGLEVFLSREEFDAVLHHLGGPPRRAAMMLVGTGARYSEMAGQHRHRLDYPASEVTIAETFSPYTGQIKPYPKGKKLRTTYFPNWLQDELQDGMPTTGSCGLKHAGQRRECRSPLVVVTSAGTPLDNHNFARAWHRAVKLSGIEQQHVRPHDLRHTFASWLLQGGVSLLEVCRMMGHSSVLVTQRYAHLGRSQDALVRRAMDTQPAELSESGEESAA